MKRNAILVIIFLLILTNMAFATVVTDYEAKEKEVEKILADRQPTDRGERIPITNQADVVFETPRTLVELMKNLENVEAQPFSFDISDYQIMNIEQVIYNTDTIPYKNRAWIGAVKVEAPSDLQLIVDQRSNRYFLYSEVLRDPSYHAAGFFIHEGEALNKIWLRALYSQGQVKQVLSIGIIGKSPIFEADYLSITTQAFMYNADIDGGVLLIFENPFKK